MNLILTSADDEAVVTDAYQDNLPLKSTRATCYFLGRQYCNFSKIMDFSAQMECIRKNCPSESQKSDN